MCETIEKIALYKARLGATESLDVSPIDGELGTIRKLMDYFGEKKNQSR